MTVRRIGDEAGVGHFRLLDAKYDELERAKGNRRYWLPISVQIGVV